MNIDLIDDERNITQDYTLWVSDSMLIGQTEELATAERWARSADEMGLSDAFYRIEQEDSLGRRVCVWFDGGERNREAS